MRRDNLEKWFLSLKRLYPKSTKDKFVYKFDSDLKGKKPAVTLYILIESKQLGFKIWNFTFKSVKKPRTVKAWITFLEGEGKDRFVGSILPSYNLSRSFFGDSQFTFKSVLAWRIADDIPAGGDSAKHGANQPVKKGRK